MANNDRLYEVQSDVILYEQVESAEPDEMWSFVYYKSNQRWLWLAINPDTGDILAYTFGKRKAHRYLMRVVEAQPDLSITGKWGYVRRLDNKSRMRGDSHVRFCEKLGVKFPGFTRHKIKAGTF